MSVTASETQKPLIPNDIAESAVLPKSYTDENVIYPAYRWLRENMPFGVADLDGYDPVWLVTKYDDLKEIEKQPDLFRNCDMGRHNPFLLDKASDQFQRSLNDGSIRLVDVLVFMDPPEHGDIKGVVNEWFMPAKVREFEEVIRGHARDAVERLLSFDGECDFMDDFALHYPLRVIMSLFGVPPEDEPFMLKLTQEFFGTYDPEQQEQQGEQDPDAAARLWHQTIQQFYEYFDRLTEDRRKNPRDDLATVLANAELDGQPLAQGYINGMYLAIATAGHDTTSATSTGGLLGMIRHPEQWDIVKSDSRMIPQLVQESIRYTSPVRHFMRATSDEAEVRGQKLAKDERLMLLFGSANRDEDVFENPEAFDMTRKPNRHVGFGHGPHMCIGQHVAKLELNILWEELLPKLKKVELNGDPKLAYSNWVGAYTSLPIRFQKA